MNTILWLRRDIRLHDNPALSAAIQHGATTALFISTPGQWKQHYVAPIKAHFLQRHLKQLAQELKCLGITLIHLKARNYDDQLRVLKQYCSSHNIQHIFANREPELDEVRRDQQLSELGLDLTFSSCDTIVPCGDVLNQKGKMYATFTPFKREWLRVVQRSGIECCPAPATCPPSSAAIKANSPQADDISFDYPQTDSTHWPLSDVVIRQVIPDFLSNKLADYSVKRDIPSLKGTSGLSPYLAIGALSPRWLATQLIQMDPDILYDTEKPGFSWLNELIWRDFYKHLLFHFPQLIKGYCFQDKYQSLQWPNNQNHFNAWCLGQTGYPIVDAAMRQLIKTGWMHNRLRMITASFLTKHLLVDWRWGERFFMQHLIDGDFSANNGGWQWSASTGCDAQPYFRIFNPILQSQKFDPEGVFIRKYLPELTDVPNKYIHFPHDYLQKQGNEKTYWPPLVDHKEARLRALEFYKL